MAIERRFGSKLADNNEHLLDIFSNDFYLELGSISEEAITKLLNKELVDFREIANFDLLKNGIGSVKTLSDEMSFKLPFMHMDNVYNKNKAYQLVLTYGLLLQRKGYKESFAPMILIPVNMYFEDETILFQMVSKPFSNPYLVQENNVKTKYPSIERFETIFDLDKYIMNFVKHQTNSVRLENYLTVVTLKKPEVQLHHEMFKLDNYIGAGLSEHYISKSTEDTFVITPLDRRQRNAVAIASAGNSFAISGYEGTGKTTTLINIAADAMKKNKRILYVSNNESTLNNVYEVLKQNELNQYVCDLTKSFDVINEDKNEFHKNQVVEKLIKDEIYPVYDEVQAYEDDLSSKTKNFLITDVMKQLILTKKPHEEFDSKIMDNSYRLYKYEINEVLEALKIIDEEMPKIKPSFKESHFRNIPITHQIKDPDEPLSLISKLYDNYCILKEIKTRIEDNDGFEYIPNYARLKSRINNYVHLVKLDVPKSWYSKYDENKEMLESFPNYLKVREIFPKLNDEIAISRTIDAAITSRYKLEGADYDVNLAIKEILSDKFTIEDIKDIDEVLKSYRALNHQFDRAIKFCDEQEDNFAQLKSRLNLTITLADDEDIDQILAFIFVLDNNYFSRAWCDYDNYEGILNKMRTIENTLDKYHECIEVYNKFFEPSSNIDNVINFLKKKQKDENTKYRGMLLKDLIDDIEYIRQHIMKIPDLINEYRDLTFSDYKYKKHISLVYEDFNKKHDAIKNDVLRYQMEKAFLDLRGSGIDDILDNAKAFKKAMMDVVAIYDIFKHYKIVTKANNLAEKVNCIRTVETYIKNVVKNQEKMADILKAKSDIILFENYLYLSTNLENLDEIRNQINTNEDYKFLFGRLFFGYDTNVQYLGQVIEKFRDYITIFKDPISLVNSFDEEKDKGILIRLDNADKVVDEIEELFQQYVKIFKFGVNKYYYDDIKTVISGLKTLLDNRNELEIYLNIANQMKVLLKNKLYNLNNFIIYNNDEKVYSRFKYSYFKHLYDEFLKTHPTFEDNKYHEDLLERTVQLENELININAEVVKAKSSRNYRIGKAKHLNYNQYILKNNISKMLYLTDTSTANLFLDISLFDIVLIDDAHMLDANEYYKVINAPQVIMAGSEQLKESISNNLISRMRNNSIIRFKYRYTPTPLNLLSKMKGIKGRFYSDVEMNKGIEVSKEQFNSLILKLFKNDSNCKINFYTSSILKAREIYQIIGGILYDKGCTSSYINKFLREKLNVSDLIHGYSINADYNIIDLYSYVDMDDESKSANMANVLLCCSKKLIIIDNKNVLNMNEPKRFINIIKSLIKDEEIHFYTRDDSIISHLEKSLARYRFDALGSYSPIDLIVEYENKYYGIMLIEDPDNTDFEVLNEFREFKSNDFPIIPIWLSDLVNDYNGQIHKIVKSIRGY